jgi:hypothetical protein
VLNKNSKPAITVFVGFFVLFLGVYGWWNDWMIKKGGNRPYGIAVIILFTISVP